jgi:prepilin-type N-terminal cleavage/methylation domain-containing protein
MIESRMKNERGMTLVEMMLALLVFSFVMGATLAFLKAQSRSFTLGSERVSMYQNTRYILNEMEKDLRTAGAGAADAQPQLVYAGASIVAFNANYWTNTPGDVTAVYYNPDAPDSAVQALTKVQKFTLPGTAFGYPDTSYLVSGVNSGAETIIFYFSPDSTTTRTDDYVLYRKVNVGTPEVVARNILQTGATPFLQYYKQITPFGGGEASLAIIAAASLPLSHSAKIHLAPNDTGPAAIIDSLRAVRVNFTTTNGRTGSAERLRTLSRMIRLPNAGLVNTKTCGDPPQLGVIPTATAPFMVGTTSTVKLTWGQATDENAGEKDVERYVLWRRPAASPDWGDPLVSIPSGSATYQYVDATVTPGTQYFYALAAQDCTPSLSPMAISNSATP